MGYIKKLKKQIAFLLLCNKLQTEQLKIWQIYSLTHFCRSGDWILCLGSHWAETEVSSRAVVFTWAQRPPLSSLAVRRIHFFAARGLRYHFPFSCWLETTLSSYWQFLALLAPINVCFLLGKVGYISLFLLRPEKSLCFYRTHVIWLGPPG